MFLLICSYQVPPDSYATPFHMRSRYLSFTARGLVLSFFATLAQGALETRTNCRNMVT